MQGPQQRVPRGDRLGAPATQQRGLAGVSGGQEVCLERYRPAVGASRQATARHWVPEVVDAVEAGICELHPAQARGRPAEPQPWRLRVMFVERRTSASHSSSLREAGRHLEGLPRFVFEAGQEQGDRRLEVVAHVVVPRHPIQVQDALGEEGGSAARSPGIRRLGAERPRARGRGPVRSVTVRAVEALWELQAAVSLPGTGPCRV
mmetsp:Transcript_960/g.2447  ORF Transcript_960/g.2447 Transcript_960/m.2447 type:complete len:205 (+) Transcript_960:580-1194(+)